MYVKINEIQQSRGLFTAMSLSSDRINMQTIGVDNLICLFGSTAGKYHYNGLSKDFQYTNSLNVVKSNAISQTVI